MPDSRTPALFRFHWDCGRMGSLDGVFVATPAEVEAAMGKNLAFGEVLGKHSDIRGTLDPGDITLVEASPGFAAEFKRIFGGTGYNPLHYLECPECHCTFDECGHDPEKVGCTDSVEDLLNATDDES